MYRHELEDNCLIIYLAGQIDSTNATSCEEDINDIISKSTFKYLLLDACKLEYISSAGLRIVLKLMRTYKKMEIINANKDVYDIFDMTGFTKMMTIRKEFRQIDLDKSAVKIGEGAKGVVYRYKDDLIVKVYKKADVLKDIQRERELAKMAFVLGIPTALSYDIVKVGSSYGTVFELLDTNSMSQLIVDNPNNVNKYAKMFVNLLKLIHSIDVSGQGLPAERRIIDIWVTNSKKVVPEELDLKIQNLMNTIEEKTTLIHGDFHTNNIMVQNDEVLLIDMDTLSYGNPLYELAIIDFSYHTYNKIDESNSKEFLGIAGPLASKFYDEVINLYFEGKSEEVIKRNREKIQFLSLLRSVSHVVRRGLEDEKLNKTIQMLKDLAFKLHDLNLE